MKQKLCLVFSIILGLASVNQQLLAEDVTWRITNPGFEEYIENADHAVGWTNPLGGAGTSAYENFTYRFLEAWTGWWTGYAPLADSDTYQDLANLPEGIYSLAAAVNAVEQDNPSRVVSGVLLYAGDKSISCNTGDGAPEIFEVPLVYVEEGGTLRIGLKLQSTDATWVAMDNFKLEYLGTIANFIGEYVSLANTFLEQGMLGSVRTDVVSKKNVLAVMDGATPLDEVLAAANQLTAAMNAAKPSVAEYAALKAAIEAATQSLEDCVGLSGYEVLENALSIAQGVYQDELLSGETLAAAVAALQLAERTCKLTAPAPADFTFAIVNANMEATPATTGWTREGTIDNFWPLTVWDGLTGMDGTALETWSNQWGAMPISRKVYQVVEGLPNGYYKLTAAAFANYQFDDAGTATTGASIYANEAKAEVPVRYNQSVSEVYSVNVLVTNNTLEVGMELESAHANWCAMDNFTLEYLCGIETNENTVTVTGEITAGRVEAINAALTSGITSVDFSNITVSEAVSINPVNPQTLFYGLPAGITLENGIDVDNAGSVVLDETYSFHAPSGFSAAVSYTREFNKSDATSNENDVSGWQSIVLPFDVTRITAQQGGETIELVPFSVWDEGAKNEGKRPFWLYEVNPYGTGEDDAYLASSSIEANTLYLISIPNDPVYSAFYNISGLVMFSGEVIETTSLSSQDVVLGHSVTPHFGGLKSGVYAINTEGSAWEINSFVNSFYGYASVGEGFSSQFLSIFGDTTTSLKETLADEISPEKTMLTAVENGVLVESAQSGKVAVYRLTGQLVQVVILTEGSNLITLPGGQYVINGNKVIVK